jgi:hypothetical protein
MLIRWFVDLPLIDDPLICVQRNFLVAGRIVQPDDLALDAQRPRNPDVLSERPGDPLGDAGLAVARGSVKEQPAAGVNCRSQPAEHPLIQQQVLERVPQVVDCGVLCGERLGRDAGDVVL